MKDNPGPASPALHPGLGAAPEPRAQQQDPVRRDQEIELKLVGEPAAIEAAFRSINLLASEPAPRARSLHSTYYDTVDCALRAKRHEFRVRRVYGRYLEALKWPKDESNAHIRGEREVRLPSREPDISRLGPDVAANVRRITDGAPLVEQFTTTVSRRIQTFGFGGARIEVALDKGVVVAQERREKLYQLELELKDGEEAALYEFAHSLSTDHNLRLGVLNKADIGFLLAASEGLPERRSRTPKIPGSTSLDDLVAIVAGECLDQFTANWPVLSTSNQREAIHQMRVGLRRLRTALALFNHSLPCPQFQMHRAAAKQLALALGPARDIDAFIAQATAGPLALYGRDECFDKLLGAAATHREISYSSARKVIADPRTSCFVLELRVFLARRVWRNALESADLPKLSEPAADFAKRTLNRLDKRALKRGKKLAELPPAEKHKLRIELKNIRYAAEFFSDLFRAADVKKYNRAAARMQEALGAYNDAVIARDIAKTLEEQAGPASSRAVGVVIGWCGRGVADGHALLDNWQAFRSADRFW
jgi:triphosphatase